MAEGNVAQECETISDKYKKAFKIGCGTFGEAWLVNSLCSGRSYVLKEVKVSDLSEDELEKTLREASVLSRCKHINIIRYKESFLLKNPVTMCLIMEYADGGDLFGKVKNAKNERKLIPEESILDWFIQIIFAVQYLHKNHILHRDLKTQNIFLTYQNLVKVGDFGIARFLRSKQELATTAIGTPYYLSPEICLRKPYSYRSDMWSVGCILYELCTLNHPFEANDFETLLLKILQGFYIPLSNIYSKLIHDLTAVLLRTDPNKRPTADEILTVPALRLVVREYIERHVPLISDFHKKTESESVVESVPIISSEDAKDLPHKNKVNNDSPISNIVEQNYTHDRGSSFGEDIQNTEESSREPELLTTLNNLYISRSDFEDNNSTPKSRGRRDSETQTPPEWNPSNIKGSGKKNKISEIRIPSSKNATSPLLKSKVEPRTSENSEKSKCKISSKKSGNTNQEIPKVNSESKAGKTYILS